MRTIYFHRNHEIFMLETRFFYRYRYVSFLRFLDTMSRRSYMKVNSIQALTLFQFTSIMSHSVQWSTKCSLLSLSNRAIEYHLSKDNYKHKKKKEFWSVIIQGHGNFLYTVQKIIILKVTVKTQQFSLQSTRQLSDIC